MWRRGLVAFLAAVAVLVGSATPALAKTALEKKVEAAQRAANASVANLTKATAQLEQARRDIAKFRAQSAENQKRLSAARTQLREYAIREYEMGGRNLVFNSLEDPNQVARTHYLVRAVALGSVDRLESYRVIREDEAQLQAVLEARLRDRTAAVAQAKAQRAALASQLASLGKAMKAAKSNSRILAKGAWVCPVQGARAFSNDWGNPRSGGRRHKGTDIFARTGTPVVAPVAGSVTTRTGGLGGNAVYVRGADGNTYYGAHLSRFASTGRVAQGQIIGYVGSSGNARGGAAHLHFEIHPGNGAAVNPYSTLRAYC
jgi:murein DD-endopeptidase MepM/ murein hydrolase activator NlpD